MNMTTRLRPARPGLLIHDSTIFDGVDERQRAEALELAASESQAQGFLYICRPSDAKRLRGEKDE